MANSRTEEETFTTIQEVAEAMKKMVQEVLGDAAKALNEQMGPWALKVEDRLEKLEAANSSPGKRSRPDDANEGPMRKMEATMKCSQDGLSQVDFRLQQSSQTRSTRTLFPRPSTSTSSNTTATSSLIAPPTSSAAGGAAFSAQVGVTSGQQPAQGGEFGVSLATTNNGVSMSISMSKNDEI